MFALLFWLGSMVGFLEVVEQIPIQRMVEEHVRMAADSTMLRMVNLFIALSLGVHLEQLEHLIGLT